MSVRAIRIDERDNVAVVTADVAPGQAVELPAGEALRALDAVPRGGKIALRAIAAGRPVVRYGEEIGLAAEDIAAGAHVHTHNLGPSQ